MSVSKTDVVTCPVCGKPFTQTRPNQVYCNLNGSKCRNYANNKKASDFRKEMNPVKSVLEKNRKSLLSLLNVKKDGIFSRDYLAGAGIDLRYFTHNVKADDGSVRSHIFDLGIIHLPNNQIRIQRYG